MMLLRPERWLIDVAEGKMILRACGDMVCELKVTLGESKWCAGRLERRKGW
jgi:hypothetical protein